jgi:hypothetical protein
VAVEAPVDEGVGSAGPRLERFSIALDKYEREPLAPAEAVACGVGAQLSELSGVTTNGTPLRRPPGCLFGSPREPESSGSIRRSNTARPNRDSAAKCPELAPILKARLPGATRLLTAPGDSRPSILRPCHIRY